MKPKKPFLMRAKDRLSGYTRAFRGGIAWYNRQMGKVYSPHLAALTGTLLVLVIAVILLFLPPHVGVADDGSLAGIMRSTGLGYRLQDLEDPSGAYAVQLYLHSTMESRGFSVHHLLIRLAILLDDLFTGDNYFSLRYLAALYVILYLPAVYLVFFGIVSRVKMATEATLITVVGAAVLGDGCVISYFQSLYPEAVWQIALVYILGFCMLLQFNDNRRTVIAFAGLAVSGAFLALCEGGCGIAAAVVSVFCARQVMMENRTLRLSVLAVLSSVVILAGSMFSLSFGVNRFTENSKLHAITNGVLLRSTDPRKTLEEFDIDPRFETLTDISVYADFPYTLSGQPDVAKDFLNRYSTGSIIIYYARHPLSFFSMLELGTEAAFQSVRSYVGNFEKTAGLPERARNPLLIFYSNTKSASLPKTLWFLMILSGGYLVLFRQRRGLQHKVQRFTPRERQIMLDTFFCLFAMGIVHISHVIVQSGTAELERYQALFSVCIDGMLLLFMAEILHRLNILSEEG